MDFEDAAFGLLHDTVMAAAMKRPALRIGPRLHGLLVIVATLSSSAGLACDPPEPADNLIHHETYGDVGRHMIIFSCQGDGLVVETVIEAEDKVLMVPLFKRNGAPTGRCSEGIV
jgi:hypothetical protein